MLTEAQKRAFKNYREKHKEAFNSYCKGYRNKYKWMTILTHVKQMCRNPKNTQYKNYGAKRIRCGLTGEKIKMLWDRDQASLLKKPSLQRIDPKKSFNFENCRFIEYHTGLHTASKTKAKRI